ncbi:arylmalonate decarboxylase [Oricola sp.]|uniref:maleate cis-trans isomerase family protein n=1 Tax=Oricola sp. TaxID=1979950 RepID=UPI0025F19794|nr:arylmalonate decarboxylase [Oricola sp.]MCI5073463.1 arylmalonate decarboxylase [Oricola sp.]
METVSSTPRAIRFDAGRHPRAKIGYVLLATEQTIQDDVFALRPDGVGVHFARAAIPDSITRETLARQAGLLADSAATLLPDGSLDVVCYACTSGSLVIGEERVIAELNRGAPKAHATTLITGVIRGLRAVGATRIAVATPYLDEVNALEKTYLERAGFEVLDIQGLNLEKDSDMVRVAPDFIEDFALSLEHARADAIFISCGALRALDVVARIEAKAGKPVITSNQAMIWDTLRLAGIEDRFEGHGRLVAEH